MVMTFFFFFFLNRGRWGVVVAASSKGVPDFFGAVQTRKWHPLVTKQSPGMG